MKIHKGWYLLLAVAALLLLIKWKFFPAQPSGPAAKPPQGAVSVGAVVALPADYRENLRITGTVLPAEVVELQPEVAGKLISFHVAEGTPVAQGQLIAKLNDADLQAQRLKIQALLRNARLEAERNRNLWEARAIPRETYDLSLVQVETQEADLALNAAQIAKTEIRAPFDGVIGTRNVSPGAMVGTSTILAKFYQNTRLKIQAEIPAAFRSRLSLNSDLKVVSGSGDRYLARIFAVEPGADPAARTFTVRAALQQTQTSLLPGDFVTVEIALDVIPGAIRIPTEALVPVLKGQQVFLIKNGMAKPQPVQIGNRNDSNVLVLSGLSPGDSVITRGVLFVKPGAPVKAGAKKPSKP